jgi:hypothetical protein
MTPLIDQFYLDKTHGVLKFVGYEPDGVLMFDKYEKSPFSRGPVTGWMDPSQRIKVDPEYHRRRTGYLRPIPPPQ